MGEDFHEWFLDRDRTYNPSTVLLQDEFRGGDYKRLKVDEMRHYNLRKDKRLPVRHHTVS